MQQRIIFDGKEVAESIRGIAQRILNHHADLEDIALVGIRTGGAFLASRLQKVIAEMGKTTPPPLGILDITLYRDDWSRIGPTPVVGKTELTFSLNDKTVVLVDDVLFTGRTVRAAMDALIDFGRPRRIELAILVDRGEKCRELPIKANYVGHTWDTGPDETINVYLAEGGVPDHVTVDRKQAA